MNDTKKMIPIHEFIGKMIEKKYAQLPAYIQAAFDSPLLKDMARAAQALIAARQEAEHLSKMIHSEDEGFSSIQKYLEGHPIDAHVLANLIGIERDLSESALEKSLRKAQTSAAVEAKKAQKAETERKVLELAEPHRRTRSKRNTAQIVHRELAKSRVTLSIGYIEGIFTKRYPGTSWRE